MWRDTKRRHCAPRPPDQRFTHQPGEIALAVDPIVSFVSLKQIDGSELTVSPCVKKS
jgi:hypothetical protein